MSQKGSGKRETAAKKKGGAKTPRNSRTGKLRGSYAIGDASVQRILDATAELLQEKGYYGTGLNEILKRSGAPRGSLYHHFPGGKDELVIRSLERSGRQLAAALQTESGTLELSRFLDYFRDQLIESDFSKGCPIAAVAQEVGNDHPEVRKACSQIYSLWEELLAASLTGPDAGPRARRLLCQIEGALLLCKTHRDLGYLDAITL